MHTTPFIRLHVHVLEVYYGVESKELIGSILNYLHSVDWSTEMEWSEESSGVCLHSVNWSTRMEWSEESNRVCPVSVDWSTGME